METMPIISRRYTVHDRLSSSDMGSMYRAFDRLIGKMVALKTNFSYDHMISDDNSRISYEFGRLFRQLGLIRHPNIINFLDYGFTDDHYFYFTMDLLENPQTIIEAGQGKSFEEKT